VNLGRVKSVQTCSACASLSATIAGMQPSLDPFRFLATAIAGWVNQQQRDSIEYLREENRVLREQLRGKRIRLTDDQRRRLAEKAKSLRSRCVAECCDASHSRDFASVASEVDSEEIRWQRPTRSRPPKSDGKDSDADCSDGQRESKLGLHCGFKEL